MIISTIASKINFRRFTEVKKDLAETIIADEGKRDRDIFRKRIVIEFFLEEERRQGATVWIGKDSEEWTGMTSKRKRWSGCFTKSIVDEDRKYEEIRCFTEFSSKTGNCWCVVLKCMNSWILWAMKIQILQNSS